MAFELGSIQSNLVQDDRGIWRVGSSIETSYPDHRHDVCFAVEADSFWFRHRAKCVIQAMRSFPPDGVVLDVGGGNGFMTEAMKHAGFDSILVEPGERGVHNAARRDVSPIVWSSLDAAGFPDHIIPAIGLFDVVEHIDDDVQFLRSVKSSLVPSGRLYITVPAYNILWSSEDDAAGHFRRYRLSQMGAKLRAAGFDVLYQTYFFSFLPLPIFVLRTFPYRLGRKAPRKPEWRIKEHGANVEGRRAMLERMFSWELGRLNKKKSIPFGGSCLVVAASRALE